MLKIIEASLEARIKLVEHMIESSQSTILEMRMLNELKWLKETLEILKPSHNDPFDGDG